VIAASLVGDGPEPMLGVDFARPATAQVDHSGQVLFLLYRGAGDPLTLQYVRNAAIEMG